jgi:beta-lactamase regulating signal transducer with metallopeptidase domain
MWVYTLLPRILNMSLAGGIAALFVLLARIPLKKVPKVFSYALWAVVLFRLVCPVSFTSEFSLMGLLHAPASANGSIPFVPYDIVHTEYPRVDLPIPGLNEVINNKLPQGAEQLAADPMEAPMAAATILWLSGVMAMLVYSITSLVILHRRLIGSVRLHSNIFLADHIPTPFVLGVIRPRIYLPSSLAEHEQSYVILHEQTHIRRLDHIIKLIAFLVLAVHWFNPLVWAAFVLCVKDMEMSCDERVLKELGTGIKTDYSNSLLSLAAGRRLFNASPLAFGEVNIKERIKNVMNFKRPSAWIIAVSLVAVAALNVGLAANGKADISYEAGKMNVIVPTSPNLSPAQELGVDMTELDYASDNIIIFHDYFGLFVYDLEQKRIVSSLDLEPIGCNFTQGDNYCDVAVSTDGKTVYLHPISSEKMYIYSIQENELKEAAYERMDNRFDDFIEIVDVVDYKEAGHYSHSAVKFSTGEFGYLHTSDWTLETLTYIRGDMTYKLFDFDEAG